MHATKRPLTRPTLLILFLVTLFLTACGNQVANSNWPGLSSDGETVYLAYGPKVLAYDAATQDLNWSYPAEANASLLFYSAPDVAKDGQVVFGDYGKSGGFFSPGVIVSVYAVENVATGQVAPDIWITSNAADDKIVAPALQVGDQVFVGTADNYILALDRTTGELQWSYETGHSIWGQPAYKDGVLVVASQDHSLYGFDTQSGEKLWQATFDGALPSSPALNDNLAYVSSFDGNVHAVEISTGEVKWNAPAENAIWGGPTYADGVVYFADVIGEVYAVDSLTGEQIWQKKAPGAVQTNPLVVDNKLYVASEGASADVPIGALTAFDVADGRELWQTATAVPIFTAPVYADGVVVVALVSEESSLIAYDKDSGAKVWEIAPPSEEE